MRFQFVRAIGVARHVGAVGVAVAECHVHHGAGQRPVGARPRREMDVRHRGGGRTIRINHHQLRPTLLPRPRDMRHHVDLGGDGIAAPHHDQIGHRHLARIDAAALADASLPAGFRQRGADCEVLPRVAHHVAQPVDAVALHQSHRAGVIERPDRFRTMLRRDVGEGGGDAVQRLIPADAAELARAFLAGTQQRMRQAVGVVDALGIARDLRADDARGVSIPRRPVHGADAGAVEHLHLERAGRGAVMRADGTADDPGCVHARKANPAGGALGSRYGDRASGTYLLLGDPPDCLV